MTKTDLVEKIASKTGLTKKAAGDALEAVLETVTGALSKGDKVTITGFGTFLVRSRRERMGRNPQTGAPLKIPATKIPAFTAGKALKSAVK
ncbi:DNA-binding protein HU [candidate division CPR3 bacterium GWF2_35_18]|uniref:DNA-binding protein HU 1 n=1 Tax=candidate division CPR3 bacterium GW2011_GWF2_35_18 TaxID=1618350 RepID=A0A0G0E326_UNCC3|nr:MAG: DNA-binding protein HU 1 [candidate division CPR3 bacterium GW2011_GWF2_35_18]KKP85475.1 MAG: DNA-binding protein HU 1 [candidate division CPR3 bacterium GW2011_GWE2_35_7]OGB63124.1 MAG: DNA-binding protein HU [candidate division CPR3 bacterium GWF2_35_18]OGB64062.1 MAG: DNA-binding protein HU [candidate division CPR3 bacterium RIFOXYA2_FULL_35_13]OGB79374.1 MAG: DNA-binding protein HU [candidate division CPR3 bacterium RIFOXYB2_FULL_35_8]OGB79912.1 MAG: DNA-binding protein HU [candida